MGGLPYVIGVSALVVAATGTAVVVTHDRERAPQQVTLSTEDVPPVVVPAPTGTPAPTPVPSAAPEPTSTGLPVHVPAPTELPTALPTISVPPLPSLPAVPTCLDGVVPWTGPSKRIPLSSRDDLIQIGGADGVIWLESHAAGSGRTSLIRVPVSGASPKVVDVGGFVDDWQLDGTSVVGTDSTGPLHRVGTDGSPPVTTYAKNAAGQSVGLWHISAAKGHVVGVGADGPTTTLFSFSLPGLVQEWSVPLDHMDGALSGSELDVATDGDDTFVVTNVGTGTARTGSRVWRFDRAGKELAWADFSSHGGVMAAIAVTPSGPVVHEQWGPTPYVTPMIRLDGTTLEVTKRWDERGAVESMGVFGDELWLNAIDVCGDSQTLTRRAAASLALVGRHELDKTSYRTTALGRTPWSLVQENSYGPYAVESFDLE